MWYNIVMTTGSLSLKDYFSFLSNDAMMQISFKMLLLAYECFYNFAPSYLVELLKRYTPVRNLRSSKKKMFVIPPVQTRSYGERSFTYTASTLWNNLPEHLKNIDSIDKFKIALKTHLFNI